MTISIIKIIFVLQSKTYMAKNKEQNVLMKCGCKSQGVLEGTNKPVCVVHFGLTPDAEIIAPTPDLTGRLAKCCYCNSVVPSNLDLPFFMYQPNKEMDSYYNGCKGWD